MRHLLSAFTNYPVSTMSQLGKTMLQQIYNCDEEGLTQNFQIMLADVPFNLQAEDGWTEDANEARYHIMFQIWMTMLGFNCRG
jgi:hypothetical protein